MKETKVRFRAWPGLRQDLPSTHLIDTHSCSNSEPAKNGEFRRSRSGCSECKRRRVKCDETFPICLRCQKRGSICQAPPKLRKWQIEAPWIGYDGSPLPLQPAPNPRNSDEKVLLQYWLERASQIMVIDPDENPLSFPVLQYLERSPSLKQILQSIGAGHRAYFDPSKLSKCLELRNSAVRLVIDELSCLEDNMFPVFLSIWLLGLSTAWTNDPTEEFGQQHLRGARALIDMMLSSFASEEEKPPYFNFMIGAYLYWDMATAFLIPLNEQVPINTNNMYSAVLDVGQLYHPVAGYTNDIFYLLANVGRYCRWVIESGVRDQSIEITLQEEMENWEPNRDNHEIGIVGDAFRSHGLISLAAICYRRPYRDKTEEDPLISELLQAVLKENPEWNLREQSSPDENWEADIRNRALDTVKSLTAIPSSHTCTNIQAIPLFTAGSELTADDKEARELVQKRFKEMYSMNRLRGNLAVLEILPAIWERRDAGDNVSWLDFLLEKNWNLMLG